MSRRPVDEQHLRVRARARDTWTCTSTDQPNRNPWLGFRLAGAAEQLVQLGRRRAFLRRGRACLRAGSDEAERGTGDAADEVRELRDVVLAERAHDLAAQVDDRDRDEREWNLAALHV